LLARAVRGRAKSTDARVRRRYLLLLPGACLAASVTMATADLPTPQAARIFLAVLIVFILPGFAVVCAVLPPWQFSSGERLLACLGISLVISTCTAVLLGATPIGLSRGSFAFGLGGITIALSVVALLRSLTGFGLRPGHDRRVRHESASNGVRS